METFKLGGKESWSTYTERLGYYFEANGVTDASKQRSILLSVCGPATFKLMKSLTDSLATHSFEVICAMVKDYLEPVPSPIVQRFKFNTRSRAPGESIAAYITALRQVAEHCQYGANLKEMLRDRLVCGVAHEATQKRLLAEKDLTFDKAYTLALQSRLLKETLRTSRMEPLTRNQYCSARGAKRQPHPLLDQLGRRATDVEALNT